MRKIADADELENELRRLVAYSQSERPSRSRVAAELQMLASRVSGHSEVKQASGGMDVFYRIVPSDDVIDLYDQLEKPDAQSAELLMDVIQAIQKQLDMTSGGESALSYVISAVTNRRKFSTDMLRNIIFKAGNAIGVRLPSAHF